MSILRNKVIDEHIEYYYPNAEIADYRREDSGLTFYTAQELQNVDADWFPLCWYKSIETGETVYGGRAKVVHTYTEGETGAGKTTRFVIQAVRALLSMKNKPSLLIVDNDGKTAEALYPLAKDTYDFKILNCSDPKRSDTYNPLYELANECEKNSCISSDTSDKIRKIAEIIQPIQSTEDPIWDQGARSYTNGLILDKFEDFINGNIPKECLTIYNIIQNHYWLRRQLIDMYGQSDLFAIPHYKNKGVQALSVQKLISVTNNAEKTKNSYFGVVENHFDIFGQPTMYSLSSNNTINVSDFINKPTIIMIQTGSSQIGEALISLLVNDIYTQVVKQGREQKLPRNIHCFLDEFANCNIADGPEFIKMLTTSRKYGMFWHMILQCDAQLDRKFDPYIGKIIRANATEIFMGSHDYETEVRFAKSCGRRTIESLASSVSQRDPQLEIIDLMTAEKLNLMEEGYAYIKSNRHPLLRTYMEAFYLCNDFSSEFSANEFYPENHFDYTQTVFFPDDRLHEESKEKNADAHLSVDPFEYEMPEVNVFMDDDMVDRTNWMYIAIKNHLETQTKENVYEVISTLTCVPAFLKNVIYEVFSNELLEDYEQPGNTNVLKFEIMEEFIKNNDFKRKTAWNRKMQEEYDRLKDSNIFPEIIMDSFGCALHEIRDELTLANIKEIRKILDQSKEASCEDSDLFEEKEASSSENPLYEELKDYLVIQKGEDVYDAISGLTCIPESLKNVIDEVFSGKLIDCDEMPNDTNILKFEIIEEFIKNNDFEEKTEWDEKMKEEFERIKESKIFPKIIMYAFDIALYDFSYELSLPNVKEIKNILKKQSN